MRSSLIIGALCLLFGLAACKDPYYPELKANQTDFLVVEGIISPGENATRIRLSRTVPLNADTPLKPERGATVVVEREDNTAYPLLEGSAGEYVASQLQLDLSKKYRIRIQTSTGGAYASEFVTIKQTPPVNISWTRTPAGVQIAFSSQDPQNNTRYYKWNYEETWEIRSKFDAAYKYADGTIKLRDADERRLMKICWKQNYPSNIRLVSTLALASDVIDKEPVLFIPLNDEKLDARYSILVRLQGLDKQGYEFFRLMKKNTESLGTIFDPQPSEISGNVRSLSNPDEKVIGYVMGAVSQERRIFIDESEVPDWEYRPGCATGVIPNQPNAILVFKDDQVIPYGVEGVFPFDVKAFYSVESTCADCRTRGSNDRPGFW